MFKIEDDMHAEILKKEYSSFKEAIVHLSFLSKVPWNKEPNKCPCISWENCERRYQIVEYNKTGFSWEELSRKDILTISSEGVLWGKKIISKFDLEQE